MQDDKNIIKKDIWIRVFFLSYENILIWRDPIETFDIENWIWAGATEPKGIRVNAESILLLLLFCLLGDLNQAPVGQDDVNKEPNNPKNCRG
jgi:hypothetical protein